MGEGVSAKNLTSEKIFVVPDRLKTLGWNSACEQQIYQDTFSIGYFTGYFMLTLLLTSGLFWDNGQPGNRQISDLVSTSRMESKFSPVLHLAKDEDLKNILGSKWPWFQIWTKGTY